MRAAQRFEVVVPYWPAHAAMYWWEHPALDVRGEFDAARAGGIEHLAIDLLWNDFQPDRNRVAVGPMRQLERVLDVAWDRGLQLRPTFFPVAIGQCLWLPSWSLQPGTQGSARVVSGHHFTSMAAYNLFVDGAMVEAEECLVREVVSAFAQHPAVCGWVVGRGLTSASPVPTVGAFEQWIGSLADSARNAGAVQTVWHDIGSRDLVQRGAVAPEAVSGAKVAIEVVADWKPAWATCPDAVWGGFLAAYVRALTGAPASVAGLGGSPRSDGIDLTGSQEEVAVAEALEADLDALHISGGGGATARALMDYCDELRSAPPFRDDPGLLTAGLLSCDGMPKKSLVPWAAWSTRHEPVRPPLGLPGPDPEERHIQPEAVARDFYEVYLR